MYNSEKNNLSHIEIDSVENSPYKKKEKRTILPNLNKFPQVKSNLILNDKKDNNGSINSNNFIILIPNSKSTTNSPQLPKQLSNSLNTNTNNSPNNQTHLLNNLKVKIKISNKSKAGNTNGKPKTNQDSSVCKLNGLKLENFNLFAVMDGHGSHGHFISSAVKVMFSEFIFKNSNFKNEITYENIYSKIKEKDYSLVKKCFQHCEATLAKSKYDTNFSGTTAVLVIQIDEYLICGNTGDSRAIIKTKKGIFNLSNDHKPDNPIEKERIEKCGGRVEKFNDGGDLVGPYRVWLRNEDYPGLAMSRSLGDFVSKSVGCSCIPDIIEMKIDKDYEYMIVASDGVWEFLENKDVCNLIQPFYEKNDIDGACNKVVEESAKKWKIEDDGQDDITCIIVFFDQFYQS